MAFEWNDIHGLEENYESKTDSTKSTHGKLGHL